jgi:2-phosphosulfolactate phosphatase
MKIIRKSLAEGAREARGLVVIIDVFRAFSCQPLFFYYGARKVILEADPAKAIRLKGQNPEFILVGEVNEVPIEGADLGNSPSEIVLKGQDYFRDKVVVHRTTSGVTGASDALEKADEVLLGSFLMARAIGKHIKRARPDLVTLVAMGDRAKKRAPEDEACGDYSVNTLKEVVFQPTAQKFIQGEKEYLPREDPIFCLQRDLFDFVLGVRKENDFMVVFRVP